MSSAVQPGDVVLAAFSYQETIATKVRPVVVLEAFADGSFVCMITGTDRRPTHKGVWVEQDSENGRAMCIQKDSFINVERTAELAQYMIYKKLGTCPPPLFEELLALLDS